MVDIFCKKCGSADLFIKSNGTQTGAYCSKCGAWIKWVSKEKIRLIERQIESKKESDLSQFSNEELLGEIKRRLK